MTNSVIAANVAATDGAFHESRAYWEGLAFSGAHATEMLRSPSGMGELERRTLHFALASEAWERVGSIARGSNYGRFILFVAAVRYVLARLGGSSSVVLTTPRFPEDGTENHNPLLLIGTIDDDTDWVRLAEATRETFVRARAHQDYPHTAVLEALGQRGSTTLEGMSVASAELHGENSLTGAPAALLLHCGRGEVELSYDPRAFANSTMQAVASFTQRLLGFATAHPSAHLGEFPTIGSDEFERWYGQLPRAFPSAVTVADLVERTFAVHSERVAIVDGSRRWTYRTLRRTAGGVALRLREAGVERGSLVAVFMRRSAEFVATIVGVLHAGAAYVPLDPESPPDRLRTILQDSGARVLVTDEFCAPSGVDFTGLTLRFEDIQEAEAALCRVKPEDLAYVIYTSGTTGGPKGVMIEHQNVVQLLLAEGLEFSFSKDDRWSLFHSQAFDMSVWEIFGALVFGATVVVVRPEVARDPAMFLDLLVKERVTVLTQTPSAFYGLAREASRTKPSSLALRYVAFGGERLEPKLLSPFKAAYPATRLVNMYGITETTVHATFREIDAPDFESDRSPIGRPLPALRQYVADSRLRPLPPGVTGELLVGGAGVGRGYLNRPELTASRFLKSPWVPGERVYRSGDRARLLEDGELEFVGRGDTQIKIRGYRVEPGEIEAALSKFSRAQRVFVQVVGAGENSSLSAYLEGWTGDVERLKRDVGSVLPPYMVPAYVVGVERFPLTVNGKLDVQALPDPLTAVMQSHSEDDARTSEEREVEAAFAEALGMPAAHLPLDHSFFVLGGDSIKALRLVISLNERHRVALRVADVYAESTIRRLARLLCTPAQPSSPVEALSAPRAALAAFQREIETDPLTAVRLPGGYERVVPLTEIELGMIYSSLQRPEEPVYYDQFVYSVDVSDLARMRDALATMVMRHEVLRSRYFMAGLGRSARVVMNHIDLPLEILDISELSEEGQRTRIDMVRAEEAGRRYAFEGDLLWNMKWFVRAAQGSTTRCFLVWSFHHAMLDGWSVAVFITELSRLLGQEPTELAPLKSSYADYAALVLARAEDERTAPFWRGYLSGYERNRLPFNHAGARIADASGTRIVVRPIPTHDIREAASLSTRLGVSHKAIGLAAHLWMLHAVSLDREIVTGVVSNDRPEIPDGDRLLGCFLRTVPCRIDVSACAGTEDLVTRCQAYLNEVRKYETSLSRIAAALGETSSNTNPIFDTLFNYQDFHVVDEWMSNDALGFDACALFSEDALTDNREMTNTLFDVEINRTLGQLHVKIKYAPAYFDISEANRAIRLYQRAFSLLAAGSRVPLRRESLLDDSEREQLLLNWNGRRQTYDAGRALHHHFEAAVAMYGDRDAVVAGASTISYERLNQRANQLARALARRSARPGDRVAILMSRSADMVAAMLAVLKAGCTYVPIDPEYPGERQQYILQDSGASLALVDSARLDLALGIQGVEVSEGLHDDATNLDIALANDSLAYIIYTSGSTGQPKGVMIEHRSATNLVEAINRGFAIDRTTRLLFVTSISFDLSVYDVFGTLAAGGTVVVAGHQDLARPESLSSLLTEQRITFWDSVPSTFNHLVDALSHGDPAFRYEGLQHVFLSGDWVSIPHVQRARTLFPNARITALGGATEATVWSNCYDTSALGPERATVPYGRPLRNNYFYVLDEHQRPVPWGAPAELYISGDGVARGYANDPERTAHRFLQDPFRPGERMYRTGDFGRMLPDGNLEFLGRSDFQLKIRGYRVEPGEIEAALGRFPGVEETIVLGVDGDSGKYLCAYVVSHEEITLGAVRAYLGERLPHYMLPEALVRLGRLPLTSNGKLDRSALPRPTVGAGSLVEHIAPATTTEQHVLELLEPHIQNVSVTESLFERGVRSLEMASLASRITERFAKILPLRELFAEPTIRAIASRLDRTAKRSSRQVAPGNGKSSRVSHGQRRLWVMHELAHRESTAYNLSGIYHIESAPDLVPERLRRAVHRVVERHEALRTVFRLEGDQLLQVPMPAERGFAWAHTVLAPDVRRTEVEERIAQLAHTPFDLEHGPLLRVHLFTVGERAVLGVCVHHIACDGWSIPLILRDLLAAYSALERDPDAALPPLEYQYRDISQGQLDDLAAGEFDGDREYWLHRLGTNLPVLQFPTDKPRGSRRGRARVATVELEEPTSKALRALAARHQASVFSSALSLIYVLMQRYSGAQEIVLGTPVAARDHHAGAQVGYYVNTLPLLLRVDPDDSFVSLLKSVRATLLEALDHSRFPFDLLVESLPLPRDLARSPLFDVSVTMENVSEEDIARAALALGWRLTAESVPPADSRFDLSFHVQDTPSIRIKIEYDSALFRDDTIAVLATQLGELTRSALERAYAPIASLQLMGVQERDAVLGNLSRGSRFEWPSAATLTELIERHVRRAPSAVALVSRTASLTYGELDHATNGVAAVLQRRGVRRGEPVIVVANGTATTLIAVLGILKAGCAYVPISVDDPPARQAMIARDCGARIVLAHGEAKIAELELVDVSAIAPLASHTAPAPDSASPAYIIYTSGTTGVPKGVVATHANAAYFVSWMASVFRVTHEDCILHRSPLVFDASVAEVFLAWCHGAKLVLASRDEGFEPDALTRLIAQHQVTIAQFVPSVLDLVVAQPVDTVRPRSSSLRQVLVAGETLRPETVRRFHERFTCPLDNCYGPTEATVNASFHRTCEGETPVPIGRPAPGAGIYVCDRAMNPVARGVAGDIWIGGPGVAAGYAGNAALTVEKFVASPFVPGERLYKTGDQGRWRADGVLEFLGRNDGQVKVRGFRVESAEVETVLVAHPDIAEATVIARRFETETELVAHYQSRTPLPSAELRTFLNARLPQYMIPAHFVHLEQFPRTPSGKIDRQSLPEPKVGGAGQRPYAAPVSGIEQQVLDAWASILRMNASDISMHDNFFELGGNSIRFLSLITVLTELTGIKPSVVDLFQNPTARGMAACLTGLSPKQVELGPTPPRGYEL